MEHSEKQTRKPKVNYRELLQVKLPRAKRLKRKRSERKLYPVKVLERDEARNRVKIHYVGYDASDDEWREAADVVTIDNDSSDRETEVRCTKPVLIAAPFSLYKELTGRVKIALNSGRKQSPCIKIEMPFDTIHFNGGLKSYGVKSRNYRGIQRYKINKYEDLNPLLGDNWHVRGLNAAGDFCYVILDTIEFYLYKRRPLIDYVPSADGTAETKIELGHNLVFTFVRGDGTASDFGRIPHIFAS